MKYSYSFLCWSSPPRFSEILCLVFEACSTGRGSPQSEAWDPPQLRPAGGLRERSPKQEGTGAPVSGSSQGNRGPQETGQEQSMRGEPWHKDPAPGNGETPARR